MWYSWLERNKVISKVKLYGTLLNVEIRNKDKLFIFQIYLSIYHLVCRSGDGPNADTIVIAISSEENNKGQHILFYFFSFK